MYIVATIFNCQNIKKNIYFYEIYDLFLETKRSYMNCLVSQMIHNEYLSYVYYINKK